MSSSSSSSIHTTRPWHFIRHAVRAFLAPRTSADIDATIRLIEVYTGRRPFRYVAAAAGGDRAPRMRLCCLGCSIAIGHLTCMWLAIALLIAYNPNVVLTVSKQPLNARAAWVRGVLIVVQAMAVVAGPFAYRQHELQMRHWERRLRGHLQVIYR